MFKDPKINSTNPPKIKFVDLDPIPILTLAMSSLFNCCFLTLARIHPTIYADLSERFKCAALFVEEENQKNALNVYHIRYYIVRVLYVVLRTCR